MTARAHPNYLSLLRRGLRRARHGRARAARSRCAAIRRIPPIAASCASKGSALGETVGLEDRLLYPQVRGERVTWDAAIATVADAFRDCIRKHGPESVAFYVSGQLLTEDYYVANKLMKGYIGSANIDTNSRLCMASAVAGHKRAFGEDVVPVSYDDLDSADLIVLVGSNTAWCHPVILQRILAAREQRPNVKIVVLDPRRTATTRDRRPASAARAPAPTCGCSTACWRGCAEHGHVDRAFVDAHTQRLRRSAAGGARGRRRRSQPPRKACGLDVGVLREFYRVVRAHAGGRSPRSRRA